MASSVDLLSLRECYSPVRATRNIRAGEIRDVRCAPIDGRTLVGRKHGGDDEGVASAQMEERSTAAEESAEELNEVDVMEVLHLRDHSDDVSADDDSVFSHDTPEATLEALPTAQTPRVITVDAHTQQDDTPDTGPTHPKATPKQCEEQADVYSDLDDDDDFYIPSHTQFEAIWQARSEMAQRNAQHQQEIHWLEEARDASIDTVDVDEIDRESDASSDDDDLNGMKKKVEWYKENVGPEEPVTLSSMTFLAEAQHKAGRRTEAARLYRIICEKRESTLADHPETWCVLVDFALLQMERADVVHRSDLLEEAALLLRKAIRGLAQCTHTRNLEGERRYWKVHHNLCLCLLKRGREHIEEALDISRVVVENYSVLFGMHSQWTLDALLHYATALGKSGACSEAITMLERWSDAHRRTDADMLGWTRILARLTYQQGKLEAAHRLFEGAFRDSEQVQDARALLHFLRRSGKWDLVEPLMNKFALIVMLRDKRCASFADGEMLKWYDAVARAARASGMDRAECLYKTALEGYQRLHRNLAASSDRPAVQKLIEKRSMRVLQERGDCFATRATSSDDDALWTEAEECWNQVVFTSEAADSSGVLDTEDPTYRSAYALSYRRMQRGRFTDARNLFDHFIMTPILEQRKRVVRTVHRTSTVARTNGALHGETLQQVADIVHFVDLNLAARDVHKAEVLLRSIIIENTEYCTDMRSPTASVTAAMRALLIMALGDVYAHAKKDVEVERMTDILLCDADLWASSITSLVVQYVADGVRRVARDVDRSPVHALAHLADRPWTPEAQCCLGIARLAERLDQLLCCDGVKEDGGVSTEDTESIEVESYASEVPEITSEITGDSASIDMEA